METLEMLLSDQAKRLFELGTLKRTPASQRNIGGDLMPIILMSPQEGHNGAYYYLGLRYSPVKTRIIPIGQITVSSEIGDDSTFCTFGSYNLEDLILAKEMSEEISSFCLANSIEYDQEFGRITA